MLKSTKSHNVAVGLLAYTFLTECAVGSSGAGGSTKKVSWQTSSVCHAAV